MHVKNAVEKFLDFIVLEKGLAQNTFESYRNDLSEFATFLVQKRISEIEKIDKKCILNYYKFLEKKAFSKPTLQRRYSALNQLFKYLIRQNILQTNPMLTMRRQKKEIKLPKFLTEEEIARICLYHHGLNKPGYRKVPMWEGDERVFEYANMLQTIDMYEAITSERPYHHRRDSYDAIQIIEKFEGEKNRRVINYLSNPQNAKLYI